LGLASYEQIIGKSDFDFWPAEVAEKLYSQEQTLFQTGQPLLDYEEPLTKLDGQKGWVSTTKIPLRDNQGNIVGLVGVGRDITEYKRAQEAIAVSRDTLQRLIQQLPIGVEIFDTQGFTIGMNDALMRIFGITEPEKVLGHFNLFTDVMAAQTGTQAAGRQALAGQVVHLPEVLFDFRLTDTRFAQAQGQAILAVTFFPVRNANNEIVQVVALNEDITARKQLEERLRRAQKLEAVGQLAGGIAHNFNNMLTAIMGYTGLSLEALPSDHPIRPDLEGIQKTAQRAARLTQQLLAFTRSQIIQPKVVNLNDLVDEMSGLVRQLIGEAIELVISPAPDLGLVKVDPGQFEQILVNLVVNASDAMPDGGRLLIETQNAIVDAAYAGHYPDVIPGDYVVVAVTDSGHGMSEEVKAHLFEPFFTTKEVGRGTGLGLATCFGIVKQHNGHITVYSEPGQGATFKIYLPRVEASLVRATLSHHSVPLAHGAETIRLAEDEIMVRERLDKNDDQ
jgi:PAS domain S-box-containing protein